MSQTNPIDRYRAAAARLRALEAAVPRDFCIGSECETVIVLEDSVYGASIADLSPGMARNTEGVDVIPDAERIAATRLICASRNLLLPLLDAGDALAHLGTNSEGGVRLWIESALNGITEAIEREIGEAQ